MFAKLAISLGSVACIGYLVVSTLAPIAHSINDTFARAGEYANGKIVNQR